MLFKSKQTVGGAPAWEVDTDTQTVRHRNTKTEIPSDFLKRATGLYNQLRGNSITYDIADPQDGEHTKLRVLDCGYAE